MSSTHDAFSIPTHSPTQTAQPLAGESSSPRTGNGQYTYPPEPSPRAFGTAHDDLDAPTPTQFGRGSLLPLHSPMSARHPHPPIQHSWNRIRHWLTKHYPELADTLNYGILPEDLYDLETQFGFRLPPPIRESYLQVDGQEPESSAGCTDGLFFGLTLLPLEQVLDEWRFWREVDEDPNTGANAALRKQMKSIPANWVRPDYSNRGWLPLATDRVGNYIGVDMNPGEGGAAGQVIAFGRDFDTKVVLWRGDGEAGWARWLAAFADDLESGDGFEIGGHGDSNSDGSEDSIGHEPYFFDGSASGSRGEGGVDGGAVGIRLIGEYRGWNVLEALADKSVKKWKDVGLVKEEEYPYFDARKPSVLPGLPKENGVEVPIPLINENEHKQRTMNDKQLPPEPEPQTPRARPAPRPLDLPTRSDIQVSVIPPDAEDDLEVGRRPIMRETSSTESSVSVAADTSLMSPMISGEEFSLLQNVSPKAPAPVPKESLSKPLPNGPKADSPDLLHDDPANSPTPQEPAPPSKKGKTSSLDSVDLQSANPLVAAT